MHQRQAEVAARDLRYHVGGKLQDFLHAGAGHAGDLHSGHAMIWKLDGIWYSLVSSEVLSVFVSLFFLLGKRKKYGY